MEGGFYMSQEEFKAMVEDLVAQEEKRLGVGSARLRGIRKRGGRKWKGNS